MIAGRLVLAVSTMALLAGCARRESAAELQEQVRQAELGFAKSMADRDLKAFESFLSREAIFFSGKDAARGSAKVVEQWRAFFSGPQAPFSWQPERVDVLESGTLALSSGPVRDPSGKQIATFNSIWRKESGGWKVVFDKGCPPPCGS